MKRGEILASAVAVAFFFFMLIHAIDLHEIRRFGEMGSGFWPIFALSAATFLSLLLLISNLIRYSRGIKKMENGTREVTAEMKDLKKRRKKFLLSVLCLLLYIIVMPWIGFIVSTFLYILAFILALEERRKMVLVISPILVTAIIVIIFAKFIGIPFPRGAGVFAAFSRLIY